MNAMGKSVIAALLSLCLGGGAGEAAEITFDQAWLQLQQHHDGLAGDLASIEKAGHRREEARRLYYPQIDLTIQYARLDQPVELGPADLAASMPAGAALGGLLAELGRSYGLSPAQLNAGLTSRIADRDLRTGSLTGMWPLYAGGRIDAAQDIALGQQEEAERQFDLDRSRQFEQLAQVYFAVVLAKEVLSTRTAAREALAVHRDHAVLLERRGQIARVERLQAEASLDRARVEEVKARHDLEIAGVALDRMLKGDRMQPATALFINHDLPPLPLVLEKTLKQHPGLAIYDAKARQAEGLVAAERGRYHPEVALFGTYSILEDDYLANELTPEWMAGIGMTVPLVDRSGRAGSLAAARSTLKQVGHLREQARQDLSVLVEKTYRQAQQAVAEYEGLRSSLALAAENVRLREKAFDQGLSTSLDVVDSRLALAGIATQRSAAAYAYVVSLARLLAMSGMEEEFGAFVRDHYIQVQ